ncbi:hypothetical protein M9458_036619, partial [Cirrhinus mrigala]
AVQWAVPTGTPTQRLHPGSQLPRLHHCPSVHQLHRPSGSALVGCPSHRSVGLLSPSSSASVLCHSGSSADLQISTSTSVARALGSALALWILGVTQDHWLSVSVSASGSTSTCSATVGRPPGVVSLSSTMTPPSIGSAVGYHHGCGLGLAWLLLLRVPSVFSLAPPSVGPALDPSISSLAPPSVVTTLDFVCCPPPR